MGLDKLYTFQELSILSKKKKSQKTNKTDIAILGESSNQFLKTAIEGTMAARGNYFNIYESGYEQLDFEIYNLESKLYNLMPRYIIIVLSVEKFKKNFFEQSQELKQQFATNTVNEIKRKINFLSKKLDSRIIILNLPEQIDLTFGNYGNKTKHSILYQLRTFNYELMNNSLSLDNLFICDINLIQQELGRKEFFDNRLYIKADIIYSLRAMPYISKNIVDIICAMEGSFNKCLILDLDNTLWGGIIGDDGIEEIQIGDLGIGKAFTEIQLWAKELLRRGIILCVCSKNNELIAKSPFLKHPDMKLKLEDISVFVANWNNKADNIRHIQKVLNIGFESMVFLDDNPFERNLVKQQLNGVTVPDLPEDPANYLSYLTSLNLFETATYSNEDNSRTKKYQEESKRNELKATHSSIDEYLKSLKMKAKLSSFDNFNVPRIAQLSQRSNQFNLRTIRYTENEISKLVSSKNHITIYCKLRDLYGDYGLISILILEKRNENLFIDTWIMSCRVLKRGVENLIFKNLVEQARKKKFKKIMGEYLPTEKNILVKDFLKDLKFKKNKNQWVYNIANNPKKNNFIKIEKE